jgi:hypothetical protein
MTYDPRRDEPELNWGCLVGIILILVPFIAAVLAIYSLFVS